jgi:hypothetical protein
MKSRVKISIYGVLVLCALLLARGFYTNYASAMRVTPDEGVPLVNPLLPEGNGLSESGDTGRMMAYGAGLFVVAMVLAILGAHDISSFIGHRAEEFIFDDHGEAMRDPEYEQAEKLWANGNYLEAIQLMREHLEKNPRHQYVALRIAEIYEKDLGNHVAAALELEQILQHKLPPERWGWAAIHLANLYSGKLGKSKEAEALLRRIVAEYGQTAAARKARERLGEPEPAPPAPQPEKESDASSPPSPPSNLPPGFRPKKG